VLSGIANCWSVGFASHKAGWLVCGDGGIVKIGFTGN
jgi:hypothetical protein